jgi:adenine phosphoribosyltransferase
MIKKHMRKLMLLPIFLFTNTHLMLADNEEQTKNSTWILDYIHPVADFPKPGIQFQWYAHLLRDPVAFSRAIREFAERYRDSKIEVIAGLDSRGFIF